MRDANTATKNAIYPYVNTAYDKYGRITKHGFGRKPLPAIDQILVENYYDYDDDQNIVDEGKSIYYGRMHKGSVNILNGFGKGKAYILKDYALDGFGRLSIESWANHLGQQESKEYDYDTADKITKVTHTIDDDDDTKDVTTIASYAYDLQGRLTSNSFKVNGEEQKVADITYTVDDLMETKTLGGGMQTIDYTYNKNNWLTNINEVDDTGDAFDLCLANKPGSVHLSSIDLFDLALKYNDATYGNNRKNGNIAEMHWQVKGRKADYYNFKYDYLNRLTEATSLDDNFNTTYKYDVRGNIKKLTREGLLEEENCFTKQNIDNLDYTYQPRTNQIKKLLMVMPAYILIM